MNVTMEDVRKQIELEKIAAGRCGECLFYSGGGGTGDCRFNPPQTILHPRVEYSPGGGDMVYFDGQNTAWPQVDALHGWCGQFTQKGNMRDK